MVKDIEAVKSSREQSSMLPEKDEVSQILGELIMNLGNCKEEASYF